MKNRLLIPFAILVAFGALFVAGCGDDEETSSTAADTSDASAVSAPALTEDEFLTQANEICAAGSKEIDAVANETFGGQQPSDAAVEQFVTDVLVPSIQGQIDAIRALTPPEEIADAVTAFLDEAESALGEVANDPSLIGASESENPFAEADQQAKALGLTECAG